MYSQIDMAGRSNTFDTRVNGALRSDMENKRTNYAQPNPFSWRIEYVQHKEGQCVNGTEKNHTQPNPFG